MDVKLSHTPLKRIGFFVMPGFKLLDLSGPLTVFQDATKFSAYHCDIVSSTGGLIRDSFGLEISTKKIDTSLFHTLLIVGGPAEYACGLTSNQITQLHSMLIQSKRIGSICTGAFLLAATGLLNNRRATTHWCYAAKLQKMYPAIRVDVDRIYIQDEHIWTSAGITAGIDLGLAMIESDLNAQAAKTIAQNMVVYYRRLGGQSQFSSLLDLDPPSNRIRKVLSYMREHLHEELFVDTLADIANLSVRQFSRLFRDSTGITPAKAIEQLRMETARVLVEDGHESLESIARKCGYHNAERMRRSFMRILGQSPQHLRQNIKVSR